MPTNAAPLFVLTLLALGGCALEQVDDVEGSSAELTRFADEQWAKLYAPCTNNDACKGSDTPTCVTTFGDQWEVDTPESGGMCVQCSPDWTGTKTNDTCVALLGPKPGGGTWACCGGGTCM